MADQSVTPGPRFKPNKWWLIGGGFAALFVAYQYKKSKANAAVTSTDTSTTDPNAIDPSTGVPYAEEGFSGASGGAIGSPYGAGGGLQFNASTGKWEPLGTGSTATVAADNQTWAQGVRNYLTSLNYDGGAVDSAISAYLAGGQSLSQSQESIIQTALAYQGPPPVAPAASTTATNAGQTAQASSLFAVPDISQFVSYEQIKNPKDSRNSLLVGVLSDGSRLSLTLAQWQAILKKDPTQQRKVSYVSTLTGPLYSTSGNVTAAPVNQPVPVTK